MTNNITQRNSENPIFVTHNFAENYQTLICSKIEIKHNIINAYR